MKKTTNQLDLPIPKRFLESLEARGEFTGERLQERKPEVYRACASLLARGCSYLSIAKVLGISVNSVSAVSRNEKTSIESEKKALAQTMRLASGLGAERIVEALGDDERAKEIPLNQLAITVGIMTEKAELLSGGATARHEWVQPAPSAEDYSEYLKRMRSEAVTIDAEVTDGPSGGTIDGPPGGTVSNGLDGRETKTKGDGKDGPDGSESEPDPKPAQPSEKDSCPPSRASENGKGGPKGEIGGKTEGDGREGDGRESSAADRSHVGGSIDE